MKKRLIPATQNFAQDYLINEFEQALNVQWIDGRPIVRRTFQLVGQTGGESVTLLQAGEFEQVIDAYGWVTAPGNTTVGFPYSELTALSYAVVFESGGTVSFEASETQVAPGGVVILEYTKPAAQGGGGG